jgi:3-phosphoshikimate 1-carboxyvinyltransferase
LRRYQVEGDWSGAAFLLVAGAIAGDLRVNGLDLQSTQADRAVIEALRACGADMQLNGDQIQVQSNGRLIGFTFDATDCPDLFPPLVALAVL